MSCPRTLCRAVVSDHFVMVFMAFLQRVHPTIEDAKMNLFCFNPQMREEVYNVVLFPFSDAEVCFALATLVKNIVATTHYSPVLAHTAVMRSSKDVWDQPDCTGWYIYDFWTADVCEV